MSRRDRRRAAAKQRLRECYVPGGVDRTIRRASDGTVLQPTAYRTMLPKRVHETKCSVTHRERVDLQVCMGMNGSEPWRPKGKRRVRYTTCIEWAGQRVTGPDTKAPKE